MKIDGQALKMRLMWVSICMLLIAISMLSGSTFILAYPSHNYILTLANAVAQALAALAIMQSFNANWWIRLPVLIIGYACIAKICSNGSDWAEKLRWPSGMPINDAVLNEAGSSQALAGLFAIVASILVTVVWLFLSVWFSKQKTKLTCSPEFGPW